MSFSSRNKNDFQGGEDNHHLLPTTTTPTTTTADSIRDYLFGSKGAFYHSPSTLGSISRCHSDDMSSSASIQTQSPSTLLNRKSLIPKRRNFSEDDYNYSFNSIYLPSDVEDVSSFLKGLPQTSNHRMNPFPRFKMILPKRMKILALDLDETLVHSTSKSSGDCDFFIEVFANDCSCLYYVFKRPWVDKFLQTVSEWYHLVIYTASLQEYADPVIHWLEGAGGPSCGGGGKATLFKRKLFRSSCIEIGGNWVKDLQLIEEDLSRICLLDNSNFSFQINPDNGIPIESWTSDKKDTGLLDLLPFLDALRFTDDVRSILSLRGLGHRGGAGGSGSGS